MTHSLHRRYPWNFNRVRTGKHATGPPGCVTCNISTFANVSQQREHVGSDLHKFNLKRKLAGQKIVDADEFDKMLDGILRLVNADLDLNESISGSESTVSTESSSSQDPLSKLLAKHSLNPTIVKPPTEVNKSRSPLIWFTSSNSSRNRHILASIVPCSMKKTFKKIQLHYFDTSKFRPQNLPNVPSR